MESRRDDLDLAAELRTLRPSPRPEFAAALDARAAAGFPRRDRPVVAAIGRVAERLRATPPRRLLAPAGAFAVAAIVVATAVVATSEDGPTRSTTFDAGRLDAARSDSAAVSKPNEGAAGDRLSKATAGTDSPGVQYSEATPPGPGPYASRTGRRNIERSAWIVLGTDPAEVRTDAAKVFDAVHAADGIVLRSSIRDGVAGEAGADFDLLIPSGKLGDALAAFSTIAEVRSRRESTRDITAPTIGVGERLQDSRARVEGLLAQLAEAETDAERAAVETELRAERRRGAVLRSRLAELRRRANLSRVSLRIETGALSAAGNGSGAWGVSDGLDDAGRILAIAAGVTIIGLAILAPLALICLLAWLAHRVWMRRARDRSLEQAT